MNVKFPIPPFEQPPNQEYEGGATRSEQDVRYDLISPHGMKALARRLALGAKKHGERNWEKGGEAFRQATISHMLGHLTNYMQNPNQEDTDALICNAMFLSHFEAKRLEAIKPSGILDGFSDMNGLR